ncbi:hypothetical protein N7468_000637 [Penicillium chermesinum]|uniref:Uncharacterized protein n=1 Tax=Penicillium chermesinum TaxID=63820 RepID=A0A9W9U0L4_9EURO|nr:uncharacterized protein N7468_000637 [Penicillium chermesinum]KAJ5249186.1 hypothetical protein N7468_000637 [Penicillium chermesinum]KAJ6151280.1 hypothetical protein N7470_007874 [Penicillium chermesinum]
MMAFLALQQLQGFFHPVARQLFVSTIAAKVDYAVSARCSMREDNIVAAQVTRSFDHIPRTMTQAIVEAEARNEPTVARPQARIIKHWIIRHTLP